MIPVDPRPFTLRELLWMAEGSQKAAWSRTSAMMAMHANINRDPKKSRPFKPSDFDPFREETAEDAAGPIVLDKSNIGMLRQALGK